MERTSAQLEQRLSDAKAELETAIENIDQPKMKKLRAEIKALPEQITLATLTELKTRVEQIQEEIETENDSMELWRVVRVDAKEKLEEIWERMEILKADFDRTTFNISLIQNKIQSLQIESREKRARIAQLTTELKNEIL
jgi:chromosome segregation ATPase